MQSVDTKLQVYNGIKFILLPYISQVHLDLTSVNFNIHCSLLILGKGGKGCAIIHFYRAATETKELHMLLVLLFA